MAAYPPLVEPSEFLRYTLAGWEIPVDWDGPPEEWKGQLSQRQEHVCGTGDRAIIGFAFARLMVDGTITAELRDRALRAVDRQKAMSAADAVRYSKPKEVSEGWLRKYDQTRWALELQQPVG